MGVIAHVLILANNTDAVTRHNKLIRVFIMLPPLKPIAMKERVSMVFIEKGQIDVKDGAFVVIDETGIRTHIPVGSIACIMLEPGTRVSHHAVALAARAGTLLVWVGEAGVRLYAAGQPGGARSDRLLYQAKLALDDAARLKVVRKMYEIRFGEKPPERRSVEQLRGIEGARVKKIYQMLAKQAGVEWKGRNYDPSQWDRSDMPNRCVSSATACLYGICEAAVLAAGYAPAIGFIHTGKPLSFVYDIADLFKFDDIIPHAFKIAAKNYRDPEREVRLMCRDIFRQTKILRKIIPTIEEVLAAGELELPKPEEESIAPAIPNPESIGDAGHRS
jgi:CRISPR-associated protein Cas1